MAQVSKYTMEKKREFFQTVYIPCDGFMVGIDQRHRLEEVLKWLPTLEHGIRGEIERVFNQSMEAPDRWADLGFANLLGRYEEAKAHNAPIAAERQRQADERRAQQDAREQQLAQERQARYDSAIREAEGNIMAGKEVINREINGKSLIMQLFREHEIPVPLKTQGWIINSLHSIRYDPKIGEWNYRYFKGSRNSTKMFDLLSKLSAAIQTRQQFEEHGASPPDSPVLDCEEEQDTLRVGVETEADELFDKSHGFYIAVIQGFFRDYYYTRGSAFSFLVEQKPEYARYFTSWEQITPVSFPNPMQNRIIENYCSGVYLSPDQVIQLLKDMEQDPKVLDDLEGLWSNGQIAVLKKALSAAAKSGVGLLEATEVVEPNPISPNESTSYSNLYHCDRDGVYLYIDAVSGQLADAIGKNEG